MLRIVQVHEKKLEKALAKLNKTEGVKEVYRQILNAFDVGTLDSNEDIFVIKRRYFTQASDDLIHAFFPMSGLFLRKELHASNLQYMPGEDPIPNIGKQLSTGRITKDIKLSIRSQSI